MSESFTCDGVSVAPGETANLRYVVSETYLGDPVEIPVTVVNGGSEGPTLFLSAAAHGDELNGVEVVREVAHGWDHADLAGTLVCLPVLNVPAFMSQQRYLPVYDRDLNRSFPGSETGTGASRIAHRIFRGLIERCDLGVDLHTSTRGRTNMLHVRAETAAPAVARLANAFGSNLVISDAGPDGALRRAATAAGVPTITVELGEAHRFQRRLIDEALEGVLSVMAEFGMHDAETVRWPGWRAVVDADETTWIRADAGGLVEMHHDRGSLVEEGERICTVTSPFNTDSTAVRAPFTGLLVGVLENPLVYPGNPLCHLVGLERETRRALRASRGD